MGKTGLSETLTDAELVALAHRCIQQFPERTRSVQDAVWWLESQGEIQITEVTRLAIADQLDGRRLHPREEPSRFLETLATPENASFIFRAPSLSYGKNGLLYRLSGTSGSLFGLETQVASNWEPYSHRELLSLFGFFQWPDRRVILFLERLVHPAIRQGDDQSEWVRFLNEIIASDGFDFRETERLSGRPVYAVVRRKHRPHGRPKNLIFASSGPKPELGFSDAINNDVVILRNAEHCLIYDEPLSDGGLFWSELADWWIKSYGDVDAELAGERKAFGERLKESLASEAEREFFAAYFRTIGPLMGERLPALVPQVYLHFDPRTLRELRQCGEAQRFLTQRMDFLLLLPDGVRVVLEIDGIGHFAVKRAERWDPSPCRYAVTAKADRELRLCGYEVYRFGAHELRDRRNAEAAIREFFLQLFRRYHLVVPTPC